MIIHFVLLFLSLYLIWNSTLGPSYVISKLTPQIQFSNFLIQVPFFIYTFMSCQFSSVSHVWLFATPWTIACQASLSFTNSQSLLKHMSIKLVMTCNHLILYRPLLFLSSIFPSIRVFSNESFLCIWWPKYCSFSFSITPLPLNIQDWFPLRLTGWISLLYKELSRAFSNTTVQKHQFFVTQLSL